MNIAVRMMNSAFGPFGQVSLRIGIGTIIAWLVLHRNIRIKQIKTIPAIDWLFLSLMGFVGYALMVYFITLAALNTKLANVSIIYGSLSIFIYLLSLLLLKNTFKLRTLTLIVLSIYGLSIISTRTFFPIIENFGKGEIYSLLAAFCGAWYFIGRKKLSEHLNNSEISIVVMLIAFVASFVMFLFSQEKVIWMGIFNPTVMLGILIGSSFNFTTTALETYSFKHLEVVLASQILLSENIFALIFGFLLYKEILTLPEIFGAGLIMFSIYKINQLSS